MARTLFVLIAAFAINSFFVEPAIGQFTIPKVKLPKITTKETQVTMSDNDGVTKTADSSQGMKGGDVRGVPIKGAKIIFSNSPDGSNPKTSFTSSENIYGRIDFGGRTMLDAFGWKAMGNRDFYYVSYFLKILPAGSNQGWEHDWHNGRTYTLVSKEEAQKTYWNFDVLPDPSKATTLMSALADELQYYNSPSGMWPAIRDMENARRLFPQNGTYNVDITIYGDSYDDWGKPAGEFEKFPTVSANLAFQFSGTDGQRIAGGYAKAREAIESAKNRKEMLHAMPDWWANASNPPEPKLAPARLVPLIKGFIGQWNLTYMKHMIVSYTGPLWVIQKNDLGIPEYRMVSPYIYVIYKDPKDNSCQVGAVYMRESYSGAGTYGAPYLGGIRDIQYIDCAAVK
ncbi:MAG: hypothetical protein KIT61_13565 [Pyrinomonadaceae bacterium]|nr:hypothetical protein [Pyrinomonadaceae bacterium]